MCIAQFGDADGVGHMAQFDSPTGVALSRDGSTLYVATRFRIRQIDLATRESTVLAGSGSQGGNVAPSIEPAPYVATRPD